MKESAQAKHPKPRDLPTLHKSIGNRSMLKGFAHVFGNQDSQRLAGSRQPHSETARNAVIPRSPLDPSINHGAVGNMVIQNQVLGSSGPRTLLNRLPLDRGVLFPRLGVDAVVAPSSPPLTLSPSGPSRQGSDLGGGFLISAPQLSIAPNIAPTNEFLPAVVNPSSNRTAALAMVYVQQVNKQADIHKTMVRANAITARSHCLAYFNNQQRRTATLFNRSGARVESSRTNSLWRLNNAFVTLAAMLRTAVVKGVALAAATSTSILAVVTQNISAIVADVSGAAVGIIGRIVGLAKSVPLPNLPLVGQLRQWIVASAIRVARVVEGEAQDFRAFTDQTFRNASSELLTSIARIAAVLQPLADMAISALVRITNALSSKVTEVAIRTNSGVSSVSRDVAGSLLQQRDSSLIQIDKNASSTMALIEVNRRTAIRGILTIAGPVSGGSAVGSSRLRHPDAEDDGDPYDVRQTASAMAAAVRTAESSSARLVRNYYRQIASIERDAGQRSTAFLTNVRAALTQGIDRVTELISRTMTRTITTISAAVSNITVSVLRVVSEVAKAVQNIAKDVLDAVRGAAAPLAAILRNVDNRVQTLVSNIISAGLRWLTNRGAPSSDAQTVVHETSSSSLFAAHATAATATTLPLVYPIGEIVKDIVLAILSIEIGAMFWWALAILIILVLIGWLIYSKVKEKEKEKEEEEGKKKQKEKEGEDKKKQKEKEEEDKKKQKEKEEEDKKKKDDEKRKRSWKPWYWNKRLLYREKGIPFGTLDSRKRGQLMHLEAHHVWPKNAGGDPHQPLMSLRYQVHREIHGYEVSIAPVLTQVISAFARSRNLSYAVNSQNTAFVAHLRLNAADRRTFMSLLLGYYAGLNLITEGTIHPGSYTAGVLVSYAKLSQ